MCVNEIKKNVETLFVQITGVNVSGERLEMLKIQPEKKPLLKQALRKRYPNLRIEFSSDIQRVEDVVDYLRTQKSRREEFLQEFLLDVQKLSNHGEYTLDSILLEELVPVSPKPEEHRKESIRYFLVAGRIIQKLEQKYHYSPQASFYMSCKNIGDLAEIYYRRGKF